MLYVCHWAKTAAATAQEPDRLQQLIQLLVGGNSFHMSRFTPLTRPFIHTGNHRFPVQLYRLSTGNIIFFPGDNLTPRNAIFYFMFTF